MPKLIISIDGPASSGKSTHAKRLACELHGRVLHTGKHYRSLALGLLEARIPVTEADVLTYIEAAMPYIDEDGRLVLWLRIVYTDDELETEDVERHVSTVAKMDGVRRVLRRLQRAWVAHHAANQPVVIEGRDAATCICPEAEVRILLQGGAEHRARWRSAERGHSDGDGEILEALNRRDADDIGHDRTHPDTPGITIVNVDHKTIEEVYAEIKSAVMASQDGAR